MRIPIFYNPFNKTKYFLHIERAFKTYKEIIPIGCDCHPAYILKSLHLRKYSLPFDWLNNSSLLSIQYAYENIKNDFIFFTESLEKNSRNNVIAKKFPYCEFLHEPNLIGNTEGLNKFKRRILRLKNIIQNKEVQYIDNITASSLKTKDSVEKLKGDIILFANEILKEKDSLHIYIRFDESFEENKEFCNLLHLKLNKIDKVTCVKYIRHNKKFPTWGDPKKYPSLLKSLHIDIKETFPKIYIRKS